MATTIRKAVAGDVGLILEFIRALAAFEREPDAVTATEADLLRDGFGEQPYYHCLIAEHDGPNGRRSAGFAFYFFNYSTWTGRPGLYLEDVFVHPGFGGWGSGRRCWRGWRRLLLRKTVRGYSGRCSIGILPRLISTRPSGRIFWMSGAMCA